VQFHRSGERNGSSPFSKGKKKSPGQRSEKRTDRVRRRLARVARKNKVGEQLSPQRGGNPSWFISKKKEDSFSTREKKEEQGGHMEDEFHLASLKKRKKRRFRAAQRGGDIFCWGKEPATN